MIPIFCVNLLRASERKQQIIKQWIDYLGLNINFWIAYDRRDIQNNKYIYHYDSKKAINFLNRELSFGEIACATTFISLYEHLLKTNIDEVIIMEDDISPIINVKHIIFDLIMKGKEEYPDAEMFILHEINLKIDPENYLINQQIHFSEYKFPPWGNMMIYLKKTAIEKLYNSNIPIFQPADNMQRYLVGLDKLRAIVSNQKLCKHNIGPSYIGNDIRFPNCKKFKNFIP